MKRFLAVAAVALAAVAVYAAVAPAGPTVVTPRQFSALSKKVAAQGKTINSLKKELASVETCAFQQAIPVAQFGNATTEGYVYQNADTTLEVQTALDVAAPADAAGYMLLTNKQCADIINGGKKKPASFRAHR
jgi:hypothetical protein